MLENSESIMSEGEHTLISRQVQAILLIACRLLSYPQDSISKLKIDINECIETEIDLPSVKNDLKQACKLIFGCSLRELRELYVSTFDLKSKFGLYLTAHEFGDSPKRGAALIKLQKTINQAGYNRVDGELADFIPMLIEFLAVAPKPAERIRLFKRLAIVIHMMFDHIDRENPYKGILEILVIHVFPKPTKKEVADLENNREEADLEELPFPIMYQ